MCIQARSFLFPFNKSLKKFSSFFFNAVEQNDCWHLHGIFGTSSFRSFNKKCSTSLFFVCLFEWIVLKLECECVIKDETLMSCVKGIFYSWCAIYTNTCTFVYLGFYAFFSCIWSSIRISLWCVVDLHLVCVTNLFCTGEKKPAA